MNAITIQPRRNLNSVAHIPGSKSCTARALIMAGLTPGESVLLDAADCDDTDHMINGLMGLGVDVDRTGTNLRVVGRPFTEPSVPIYLGNSGTAMRFLTAACATLHGTIVLDGSARMRERPIADLVNALREWNVDARTESGCPPVRVTGMGSFGGTTHIKGSASSQYLSALLMVAPYADREVAVLVEGELVSKPYVELSIALMAERGVNVVTPDFTEFRCAAGQCYTPGTYPVEADASGASYFFAAAAVAGGRVRVMNITSHSHQGDARFPQVLERMGCRVHEGPDWIEVESDGLLKGIDVDLNDMPDMAQTLAVTALFAEGPTRIRNVANLRIKETDRIAAPANELRKLGATVTEFDDGFEIVPGPLRPAAIDTYDDHRMAMSFALAGLRIAGVRINDPTCVSKTFPDFFDRFSALS